jgi:hypothetical protein
MDITTRAEAIAAGLDRYFTGKQCANGHLSPRYVSQHRCVDCRAERDKKYRTENIRITGQLIDAVTGRHMWADRFERDLTDIFALQDEVTVAVVSAPAFTISSWVARGGQSNSKLLIEGLRKAGLPE